MRPWLLPSAAEFLPAMATRPQRPAGNYGSDLPYTTRAFDDSPWRRLDLPHDWAIEGPFQQDLDSGTGKLPWSGAGWYRMHFQVPASAAGRRVSLEIDGAMSYAVVWLNGQLVGGWPYGYSSFSLDLTPYLAPGEENVLAIRLDNVRESSRWYPGAGIYRNVWLVTTGPVHVAHWGTVVTTPRITPERASVLVNTLINNNTNRAAKAGARRRCAASWTPIRCRQRGKRSCRWSLIK